MSTIPTPPPIAAPPAPRLTALLGHDVAGFRLVDLVSPGSGASAAVYRGIGAGGAQAAIKIYPPGSRSGGEAVRLERERSLGSRVRHPAVLAHLGAGHLSDGSAYLQSAWIDGVSLEARLGDGPLAWATLRPIILDLADGLAAVHDAGIVHRDVKPANVMLPRSAPPAAVLVDFGHASDERGERVTAEELTVGTAAYMAPEQASGAAVSGRTDLYALGVVLYRALTGALPFGHRAAIEILRMHQREPVTPPSRRTDRPLPEVAEALCLWLLEKDPARRPASARVLSATIRSTQSDAALGQESSL
jgi:serine/threonine protein kinase